MHLKAWAAITTKLGGLNNKIIFLSILKAGSPRSECQHSWIGESSLSGFSLSPHIIERERASSLVSHHIRALIPSLVLYFMTLFNSNYLCKSPCPHTINICS